MSQKLIGKLTNSADENEQPTYADKTNRIQAWSQLIKSITPFIWLAIVLIVIIPLLGRGFIANAIPETIQNMTLKKEPMVLIARSLPNQSQLDRDVVVAIQNARQTAEQFASQELDDWIDRLSDRVDNNFLDWYFNYFNQKKIEFSAPFVWLSSAVTHSINAQTPAPNQVVAEKLTEDFQTQFAKRVLRPKVAQLHLERITRNTVNLYVSSLENSLANIQSTYQIPQGQWERYLDDIAITISDTSGNISNLSMKFLAGGSTYLFAKAMIPVTTKIGSKMAIAVTGKASAKVAAKTGGVVAGKLGVQFLDPIVAVGILFWDLWDYHHTVEIERPILREAILDYLAEVKASLLENHKDSIMAAIYQVEDGIIKSLSAIDDKAA